MVADSEPATGPIPHTPAPGPTGRLVPLDGAGIALVAVMAAGSIGLIVMGVLVLLGLQAPAQ
ncbi:MAG: hypothetical protein KGP10_06125 [Actinomycetales bacterium]|nr:hypothetical protein [Actinomycetales bacterium]